MGTTVHLLLDGPEALLDYGQRLVQRSEERWSRFDPSSELCRINAHAGSPTVVSEETFVLIESAIRAWRETDGLFDPTILTVLEALGYDRSFQGIGNAPFSAPLSAPPNHTDDRTSVVPGPASIGMHPTALMVELPVDLRLDLGGIAKGATADMVVGRLQDAGAVSACVSIGGDLRVSGPGPVDGLWEVAFADDVQGPLLHLASGAVCTSSVSRRSWVRNGSKQHHLIDPTSSRPMESDVTTSTVIARTALSAEILAKMPIGWGSVRGAEFISRQRATGRLVLADGSSVDIEGLDSFLAPPVAT